MQLLNNEQKWASQYRINFCGVVSRNTAFNFYTSFNLEPSHRLHEESDIKDHPRSLPADSNQVLVRPSQPDQQPSQEEPERPAVVERDTEKRFREKS